MGLKIFLGDVAAATVGELARLKFRRWYERQLVIGHAWMVTGFLCLILLTIGIEMLADNTTTAAPVGIVKDPLDRIIGFVLIVVGAAVCMVSWLRYQRLIAFAEKVAGQAQCPECLKIGCTPADASAPLTGQEMIAKCRFCQHRWPVDLGAQDLPGR